MKNPWLNDSSCTERHWPKLTVSQKCIAVKAIANAWVTHGHLGWSGASFKSGYHVLVFDTTQHPGKENQEGEASRNSHARKTGESWLVSLETGRCGNIGHVFKYQMALVKQRDPGQLVI